MSPFCPWCEAPRAQGPKCPQCGAIYAKAEALRSGGRAPVSRVLTDPTSPTPPPAGAPAPRTPGVSFDPDVATVTEWKLRAAAVPAALGIALLFHASALGHFLQRTFFSMAVHEVGHAVTAWWCGFAAFPALWVTLVAEQRGVGTPLVLVVLLAALVARGVVTRRARLVAAGVALGALQLVGTCVLSRESARALITFGGDGGAMVLGTALMATFFAGSSTRIYRGRLRWGFLVIGAAAFVDTFATWWAARADDDAIPFGEIEGVGLSDPSTLSEVYGWSTALLVHRYVTLGCACLAVLCGLWVWGVWQARRTGITSRSV